LLLGLEYCSGSFLFLVSFSFLAGSIRTAIWFCVVGEAWCNWYLLILINFLYQKKYECMCYVHLLFKNVELLKENFFYLIIVCGVLLPKFARIHVKHLNIIN
jgi:hypothetical protein